MVGKEEKKRSFVAGCPRVLVGSVGGNEPSGKRKSWQELKVFVGWPISLIELNGMVHRSVS
jgi:hypothetical protein